MHSLFVGCCGRGLTLTLSQSSNRLPATQGRWWKKSAPATSFVVTISLFGLSSLHLPVVHLFTCSPKLPPAFLHPLEFSCGTSLPVLQSAQFSNFRSRETFRIFPVLHFRVWGLKWLTWPTNDESGAGSACTCKLTQSSTHNNTPQQLLCCYPRCTLLILPSVFHGTWSWLHWIPWCCSQMWLGISSFLFSSILFSMTWQFLSEQLYLLLPANSCILLFRIKHLDQLNIS